MHAHIYAGSGLEVFILTMTHVHVIDAADFRVNSFLCATAEKVRGPVRSR